MTNTVTKAELSEALVDESDLNFSKHDAKHFVDLVFETMRSALEQGTELKISRFGNFALRRKKKRPGRNPKTKEEVDIMPRRVVTFRAGKKLKDRIAKSKTLLAAIPPDEEK